MIHRSARSVTGFLTGPLLAATFILLLFLALISPTSARGVGAGADGASAMEGAIPPSAVRPIVVVEWRA